MNRIAQSIKNFFILAPNITIYNNRIKLEDGIRIHEDTKVALDIYARDNKVKSVKPFVLVVAQNTNHASRLEQLINSKAFFEGYYADKVMEIHFSQTGTEKEENIAQLISLENPENKIEIDIISGKGRGIHDSPENIIVNELINYPEIDYDEQSDLLFKLTRQAIEKFRTYLDDDKLMNVVQYNKKEIGSYIYSQMMQHFYCEAPGYEKPIVKPFTRIEEHNFSRQYHPDFVIETKDAIYVVETKKEGDIKTSDVQEFQSGSSNLQIALFGLFLNSVWEQAMMEKVAAEGNPL